MKILNGLRQTRGWNVTPDRTLRLQNLVDSGMLLTSTPFQENGPVKFRISFIGRSGSPVSAEMSGTEIEAFLLGVNAARTQVVREANL